MIDLEEFNAFYNYKGNFNKFASDFFGIETTHDLTERLVDFLGPEEAVIAYIVWKMVFTQAQTFLVVAETAEIAREWRRQVIAAMEQLPAYMHPGIMGSRDEITTGTGNRIYFRRCNENTARGMTINIMFAVEPQRIKPQVYEEFMRSALPTLLSGKNRQYITCTRGY